MQSNYSWEDEQGWIRFGVLDESEALIKKNAKKFPVAWEAENYAYRQNMEKVNNIGTPEALAEGKEALTIDGAETK